MSNISKLSFKQKLNWTITILVIYFTLGLILVFGASSETKLQLDFLSVVLGAQFGSIISLGIGPIVTASIILQLLNGSGLFKFDMTTHEGKQRFQGFQKLFSVFFISYFLLEKSHPQADRLMYAQTMCTNASLAPMVL